MIWSSFRHLAISALSISYIICARAISDIGISQDAILPGISYSAMATFEVDVSDPNILTDRQLKAFCSKAYDEMLSLATGNNAPKREIPVIMACLAVGKDMYFASSMKLARDYYYKNYNAPLQLTKALDECQVNGETHRKGGACGEINAVALFYDASTDRDADLRNQRARIAAWGIFKEDIASKKGPECKRPCTESGLWGCLEFCRNLGITAVMEKGRDIDDSNLEFKTSQPRSKCNAPAKMLLF